MRFKNYGSALKSRRASGSGYPYQTTTQALAGYGATASSGSCSSGYSPDANGCCVDSNGLGDGCGGLPVDSNCNCITAAGTCAGCPGGCASDGTCLSTGGTPTTTTTVTQSTPWYATLGGGIGTTLSSIFGTKPVVKSTTTSGTSIILPLLFVAGAIGATVYLVKRKK